MSKWIEFSTDERKAMIQGVVNAMHIDEAAAEKDWWVTAVLYAVFKTKPAQYLLFKGGTSRLQRHALKFHLRQIIKFQRTASVPRDTARKIPQSTRKNNEINNFKNKLKHLIEKSPTIDITAIGFPTDWKDEPLWSHCTTSEKYC